MARPSIRADLVGIVLSVACVIHCIALPLLAGALPALAGGWFAHQGFHILMAVLALCVGGLTFLPGYRRHGLRWIPALGLSGILALALGAAIPCGGHDHDHGPGASACCDHRHGEKAEAPALAKTAGLPAASCCDHDHDHAAAAPAKSCCTGESASAPASCCGEEKTVATHDCGGAEKASAAASCCSGDHASGEAESEAPLWSVASPKPVAVHTAGAGISIPNAEAEGGRPLSTKLFDLFHHLITPLGCACLVIAHIANRRRLGAHSCARCD